MRWEPWSVPPPDPDRDRPQPSPRIAGSDVAGARASRILAALRAACAHHGLDATDARLIHHYSNAVFLLPAVNLVARLAQGANTGDRPRRTQAVVEWLVEAHAFPATAPAGIEAVTVQPDITVTFWRYYPPTDPASALTSAHLGRLLRRLHSITDPTPSSLQRWVPLEALDAALNDPETSQGLTPAEHDWVHHEIRALRHDLGLLESPLGYGLIHGDAWAGNLLWDRTTDPTTAILGDWDWVSHGPREVDLIPTWHATRRYGRTAVWTKAFADVYGYDLTNGPGLETWMRMRDLVQLTGPLRRARHSHRHREALHERLSAIRAGDTTSTWLAL